MIKFENVNKSFKDSVVLSNLSFNIQKGNLIAIIGGSGCGKTTTLKMINRLIKPTHGKIFINNEDISTLDVITLRRNIGYVIQQGGLFPHMTIRENIELIPHIEKKEKQQIINKTANLMEMIALDPICYLDRYPNELSGGQQQRIGIARAFANDPEIVLMDEPFSALDPITRNSLQDELLILQAKFKKTIVFVTHDMDEAIKIADKICILEKGSIIQYDTPENILKSPINSFVSSFVGKNRIWNSPEYIKAADIMLEHPITSTPENSLFKCMERMRSSHVDSLMIVEHSCRKLIGILKANSIRSVEDKSQPASAFMETNIVYASPHDTIVDILELVNKYQLKTVPVLNEKKVLLGIITNSSLVTTFSQQYIEAKVI